MPLLTTRPIISKAAGDELPPAWLGSGGYGDSGRGPTRADRVVSPVGTTVSVRMPEKSESYRLPAGVVQRGAAKPITNPIDPFGWWGNVQIERRIPVNVGPRLPIPPVSRGPSGTPVPGGLPQDRGITPPGGDMPLDLGDLLGKGLDVWGAYKGIGNTVYNPPVIMPVGAAPAANDSSSNGPFGIPGVEVISESKLDAGLVYKKVCGQYRWVKQKRRRRRKLLTDADFNALLRIQALKTNANMQIAIAKALGR